MNKSINSIDNYKQSLKETSSIVINKYLDIVNEYITFAISNIHIQKNNYFKYVIIKGIETIQYVFIMLLLYTKNLDLVHQHCCKAFYYYVEFIGQVGDDSHVFLRLTSKDAILFVYKKTIFEINDSFKRTFDSPVDDEKKLFDNISTFIDLFNSCLFASFNICDTKNSADRNNIYVDCCNTLIKSFIKLSNCEQHYLHNNIKSLEYFNTIVIQTTDNHTLYIQTISYFIKKICKTAIDPESVIKNKFITNINDENMTKNISTLFD